MEEHFETLRTERLTASGKACVDIAERLATKARTKGNMTEARMWVRLALIADNTELERKVKRLEELILGKGKTQAKAQALEAYAAELAGGNVVPMSRAQGDGI